MFVTLAVPHDGHKPDETVELDDVTGKQLIRDGYARPAEAPAPTRAPKSAQPTEDSPTTGPTEEKE